MILKIILGLIILYFLSKIILSVFKVGTQLLRKFFPFVLLGVGFIYREDILIYWRTHPSVILLALAFLILFFLSRLVRKIPGKRLSKSTIWEIDHMSGEDFEKYLEILFKKKGYQVERTAYVGDYGVDLVVQHGFQTYAVQAKRYRNKVGVKAVQEVVAGMGYYDCHESMVVTNSYFTPQAIQLAEKNGVILWDRTELLRQIRLVHNKKILSFSL